MALLQNKNCANWIPASLQAHVMLGDVDVKTVRFIDADPQYYPANYLADALCDLLGIISFTPEQLTKIRGMGCRINEVR